MFKETRDHCFFQGSSFSNLLQRRCNGCHEIIILGNGKYYLKKLNWFQKIKKSIGFIVETRYLCQPCNRQEQLKKII